MLLLLFGGVIVVAAVALLRQPVERACFVLAGVALEGLGFALAARVYAVLARIAYKKTEGVRISR